MTVEKVTEVKGLNDMADINARLMGQVYDDDNLAVDTKMKLMSAGIRNATTIRAEQRKTMTDLARLGLKPSGQLNKLTFGISEEQEK